jgi:hypothetical protein
MVQRARIVQSIETSESRECHVEFNDFPAGVSGRDAVRIARKWQSAACVSVDCVAEEGKDIRADGAWHVEKCVSSCGFKASRCHE